jgi:putative ABC transport system permease protein
MISTFFKIAFRSFLKNKLGTSINLFGFSVGLAASMLIFTYVYHEMSYDSFHEKSDRIYRVDVSMDINGDTKIGNITPNILGPKTKDEIPGVESFFRMTSTFGRTSTLIIEDRQTKVDNFFNADSSIFDVFTFKFIGSTPKNPLNKSEDAIISANTALKYYGTTDVIGKTFRSIKDQNYIIRAVFEDFPGNSHLHPNFIGSSLSTRICNELTWDQINYLTFVVLDAHTPVEEVQSKLSQMVEENMPDQFKAIETKYNLMPLTDIHLRSEADFELEPAADIKQLYAYLAIAFFIMLIACVNYINLSTSRALERAKEVGIKKVVGAQKWNLIGQFLFEAYLITFFSMILAVGLFEVFKPLFTSIVGKNIGLSVISNPTEIGILFITWVLLALLAGFYPSLVLTSFKPAQILKGNFKHSKYGNYTRKSLVVFQFVISSALIVGTLVVYNQINFMKTKKLGFAKDQLMLISMDQVPEDNKLEGYKKELLQHNNIHNVSFSSAYPGRTSNGMLINADGMAEDEQLLVWNWHVDKDYLKTMDIELLAGKDFNESVNDNNDREFIINEAAMKDLNWDLDNCIGRKISMGNKNGRCIGVVKDFHFSSLQDKVEPLVLHNEANPYRNNIMIRFGEGDIASTLEFVEHNWQTYMPQTIFEYKFLDESFDRLFASEQRTGKAFSVFSLLSILIAAMGLFGLSAYDTISRTKEIGIRKSMGSSNVQIFNLLVTSFSKLALFAFLISVPLAYIIMNK